MGKQEGDRGRECARCQKQRGAAQIAAKLRKMVARCRHKHRENIMDGMEVCQITPLKVVGNAGKLQKNRNLMLLSNTSEYNLVQVEFWNHHVQFASTV